MKIGGYELLPVPVGRFRLDGGAMFGVVPKVVIGAGGTAGFLNLEEQEYSPDIEVREKPGTPGILQTLRTALALEEEVHRAPWSTARPWSPGSRLSIE
jgi:hypothetical protein